MKTNLPSEITTKEQAITFLKELHRNNEEFHPDDDAGEIEDSEGSLLFTVEEAIKINDLFEQISEIKDLDPCEVLLILNAMEGAHNLELVNDLLNGTIKREVCYTYYFVHNGHTRNYELYICKDYNETLVRKYDYSVLKHLSQDVNKLREYEIYIEEQL